MDGAADETSKAWSIVPCSRKSKRLAMKSKPLNSPINNLMDCLLIEILKRLPSARSVIRCKSVSKRWFDLISSPYFIHCFLHHHIMDNDHIYGKKPKSCALIISYYAWKYNRLFITSNNEVFSTRGLKLTYFPCCKPEERESVCVVASCNDLLCCTGMKDQSVYYICNPFTMQWVALPPNPNKNNQGSVRVGFICEPYLSYKENQKGDYTINPHYKYKVVRIPNYKSSILEIFSSDTNKWSECEIDMSKYLCGRRSMTNIIACNGMIHWLTMNDNIVAYNPYNIKQIRFIDRPAFFEPDCMDFWSYSQCLGVCRGILRMIRVTHFSVDQILSVWELKNYNTSEWSLEYEFSFNEISSEYSWAKGSKCLPAPQAIHPDDGDIVYLGFESYMISCNMKEKELEVVGKSLFGTSCYAGDVFPIAAPWWPTPVPTFSHSA